MLPLLLAIQVHAAPVTPMAGLEWRPLSRADLTWVADNRTSGTEVGEFDGFVSPSLVAFGGLWVTEHFGVLLSIGVARLQSTTWVEDVYRQRHWGVVRPALDLRYTFTKRHVGRPVPWVVVGAHGDIPSARDVSNGFTEDEQDLADQDAYIERARLGGFGGRVGLGADYRFTRHISLGLQYTVLWHRGVLKTSEQSVVSSWLTGEAAALLTLEFPRE